MAELDWGYILSNCGHSLRRVLSGVAAAAVIGVSLGLLRSALPPILKRSRVLRFVFEAPKFPPPIAWIPFVILAFGIGELSAATIVFIGAFSPIFTSAFEAGESLPHAIRDTARSMEIRGPAYLFKVLLPASLPQILTGIRVGVSMGWMSVIAAEMISGQSGLGYSIQLNRLNLQYQAMVLDVVLIGAIGFALYEAITWLERRLIPWHEKGLAPQEAPRD